MRKYLKPFLLVFLALTLLLTGFAGCGKKNEATVSVQSVSMITGYGALGLNNRYAGIVEAGSTVSVRSSQARNTAIS